MTKTPAQQLELLQSISNPTREAAFRFVLVTIALSLFVAAITTNQIIYFFVGAFFLLSVFLLKETFVHADNAVKAINQSLQTRTGTVTISTQAWSESTSYYATTKDNAGAWNFEFIPQGWSPRAGTFEAQLRYIIGVAWPVLVLTKDGIIFPRRKPAQTNFDA